MIGRQNRTLTKFALQPATRAGWIFAWIALAAWCLGLVGPAGPGVLPAHADGPKGKTTPPGKVDLSAATITNRDIRLTAGPDGPTFGLDELQNYKPPPPLPHSPIMPKRWNEYPAVLREVPLVSRQYAPETVAYLAGHEIHHGDGQSPYVALTFDCEVGVQSTRQILDILHEEKVHATFFIMGKYAYMWPEIIREIAAGKHELASHSFSHPLFTSISTVTATQEITYTEAAVAWAVGTYVPMRYFRFPYGGRNDATRQHVATLGYQSAFWDMDPRGWDPQMTSADVVAYVRRTAHPGGIVIMHCGCMDDANALRAVIQAIRDKHLIPGTLSDVLGEADRDVPGYASTPGQ